MGEGSGGDFFNFGVRNDVGWQPRPRGPRRDRDPYAWTIGLGFGGFLMGGTITALTGHMYSPYSGALGVDFQGVLMTVGPTVAGALIGRFIDTRRSRNS